jgi:hypothetical protein
MFERGLIPPQGGVWIDCYNQSVNHDVAGSLTTRINSANHYFVTEMVEYPINTDSEGNAFTLNTRYSAMGSGNVMGGAHFPMTAVVEHDELTPPPKQLHKTKEDETK